MSLEHSLLRVGHNDPSTSQTPEADIGYWYELIGEALAADFLDLSVRSMQGYRYRGGGPYFVRLSSRCVKYRRIDLRKWSEARLRSSTSDRGQEAAI
jgi:hypothetical protein